MSDPDQARRAGLKSGQTKRRKLRQSPVTSEVDYSADEVEFLRAMDAYKRRTGRQFPTWSEVLDVVRDLGYCKPPPPDDDEPERPK